MMFAWLQTKGRRSTVADLPLILALARARTLAGAAEKLDVDLSTVYRRLNALEHAPARAPVRPFGRGYQLTAAGERAAGAAERVETELLSLDREITGRDQQLSGVLRVTASETLSHAVLPRLFAAFHAAHPRIQLVLSIDNRMLDLSRREADVALRVQRPGRSHLVWPAAHGHRVGVLRSGGRAARIAPRGQIVRLRPPCGDRLGRTRAHRRERLDSRRTCRRSASRIAATAW